MSIASASHRTVFGIRSDISQPFSFLDESTLLYCAGANLKKQKFIPISEDTLSLTGFTVNKDREYVAVGEQAQKPQIVIYDIQNWRRRKVLVHFADTSSSNVYQLEFSSSDGRYIAALFGPPDWNLVYYAWEKGKVLAVESVCKGSAEAVGLCVSINPGDGTQIVAMGRKLFKMYHYGEGAFSVTTIPQLEKEEIAAHCWIAPQIMIVGTRQGKLFLVSDENVVGEIRCSFSSISSLCAFPAGFVCGDIGANMSIYERTADGRRTDHYSEKMMVSLPENTKGGIQSLTLGVTKDRVLCTTNHNEFYMLSLSSLNFIKEETQITPVLLPFHHGAITGLDICIRKPIAVTCSVDHSVRIWNYADFTLEMIKYYSEEPQCVAIHPAALYVLIGFTDKLRFANLLIDDLRTFREFSIRGCRECCFSNGGQYFAATTGNIILIYSTWTFDVLGTLKGHNGKVKSITWSHDDSKLVSSGTDGAVYTWDLRDYKRDSENILKSCSYSSAVCSPDGKFVYAVGSDRMLKEMGDSLIIQEVEFNVKLTQVVLSHSGKMMFCGTANGSIRAIKFPLIQGDGSFQEHSCHNGSVTKVCISHDDQLLFSAGEDGVLYIFTLWHKDDRMKRDKPVFYTEEILVTKSDLEEKKVHMQELKNRIEELKMENEYQLRLKDMTFNDKMKELTDQFIEETEGLKITTAVQRTEKDKEELKWEEELGKLREKHQQHLQDFENKNNKKLMSEYEKYQDLQNKFVAKQEFWEAQQKVVKLEEEKAIGELTNEFEQKLRVKLNETYKLKDDIRLQKAEFQENERQLNEDLDLEIQRMMERNEKKLKAERELCLRLKGENGLMRKKFNTLHKDIEENKVEEARMREEERRLREVITNLEQEVASLRKEMSERDETIQDKEKRVYELKKKNQELEKFKFVLDYKIKELKRQIEPKENEIAAMTEHIQDLNVNLEECHRYNASLGRTIHDVSSHLEGLKEEIIVEHSKSKKIDMYIKKFKRDMTFAVDYIQEPDLLRKAVENLFGMYCSYSGNTSSEFLAEGLGQTELESERAVKEENMRQKEYLQSNISALRKHGNSSIVTYRIDGIHTMLQNETLIKEIHQLRKLTKPRVIKKKNFNGVTQFVEDKREMASLPTLPATPSTSYSASNRSKSTSAKSRSARTSSPERGHEIKLPQVRMGSNVSGLAT